MGNTYVTESRQNAVKILATLLRKVSHQQDNPISHRNWVPSVTAHIILLLEVSRQGFSV